MQTRADASQITFKQGVGGSSRKLSDKLGESVSVKDFGAVGDGVTDDTAAIQAAIDSLGSFGGSVYVPNNAKLLIDNTLTIPSNVSLVGPHKFVGSPQDNSSAPYGNVGGTLIVNPATHIALSGGSSLSGFFIYRKGMTFPASTTSAFTGTAIIAQGDDVGVDNCLIMGFNKAYYSTGKQRPRLHNVYMDCINGIDIAVCYDIPQITECHAWPFATIASVGAPLIRSGTAYSLHDVGDWAKITNCFSYGYARGCAITNANSVTLLGCGFDNVPGGHPGSIGIEVSGNCVDTRIVHCQTAAHMQAGIFINTATSLKTSIIGHNVWGGMTHGVLIYDGDVSINNVGFRELGNAVTTTTSTSIVDIDSCSFRTLSGKVVNATVQTASIHLGNNNDFGDVLVDPTVNMTMPAVASAASVALPSSGEAFYVTGTTGMGTLTHAWPGRVVTLLFTSALTVYSSTGTVGSMRLNQGLDFAAPAGGTLTLLGIGGNAWVEIGRCS